MLMPVSCCCSPSCSSLRSKLASLRLPNGSPSFPCSPNFQNPGGLIVYGPNVAEIFRKSGEYVGKVLHGAKPSDLPIQRPEKFNLVINIKTATALGLDMATQLQQLADEVIE